MLIAQSQKLSYPKTKNHEGSVYTFNTQIAYFGIYLKGKEAVVVNSNGDVEDYYSNIDQHPIFKSLLKEE